MFTSIRIHGQFSSNFDNLSSNFHHATCFRTILPSIGAWEEISKLLSVYYCVRPSMSFFTTLQKMTGLDMVISHGVQDVW